MLLFRFVFTFLVFGSFIPSAFAESSKEFIDSQVQRMVDQIEARQSNESELQQNHLLQLRATRNGLTDWLYEKKIIEYSDLTLMFSDKLLMGKILYHYLGTEAPKYHPPVMGLKEFLEVSGALNEKGEVTASAEQLKFAFKQYFSEGFILKPPISWATDGKGFYAKEAEVIDLLINNDAKLYEAKEFHVPFLSPLATKITSGERWMVMGKIKNTSISQNKGYGLSSEFRVHTFQSHVIQGATLHRYGLSEDETNYRKINQFAQNLLNALPLKLVQQQAWGFDVFLQGDGQPILIEVNTNRGHKTNWSDFLRTPQVLAGYANFFEKQYGWHIEGIEGKLFRAGVANLRSHLKHEFPYYVELIATGSEEQNAIVLKDLKETSMAYFKAIKAIKVTKSEKQNHDYKVTYYTAEAFKNRMARIKVVGDAQWNEFVAWLMWFQEWDGN